jgi:hypothetical protein
MATFAKEQLERVKITVDTTAPALNAWRERMFGHTDEKEGGTFNYRIDTTNGCTARIKFYASKSEILYEFERTQRT